MNINHPSPHPHLIGSRLKTSEEAIRAIFRSIPLPTFVWQKINEDFILVDYNDATVEITKGKISQFLGAEVNEIIPDIPEVKKELRQCFTQKTSLQKDRLYRFRTTGKTRHLSSKYVFVPPDLVLVHSEDITLRVEAENKLKKSEKKYRELANLLPQTIFEANAAYDITYANQTGLDAFGYSPEDFKKGINIFEIIIPEEREKLVKNAIQVMKGERTLGNEYTALRKDGTTFPINAYTLPIIRNGKVVGLRGIVVDISKLKAAQMALKQANEELEHRVKERTAKLAEANNTLKAEIAQHQRTQAVLKQNEKKYRAVVEQSMDSIFLVDLNTKYVIEANPAFHKLLGYSTDEVKTMQVYDFVAHDRDDINQKIEIVKDKGYVFLSKRKYQCKDGQLIDVEVSINLVSYDHKNFLCVISRDITNRVRYESIQRVIYQISESISRTEDLNELFKSIRFILGEVIETANFYVAILNDRDSTISFPYIADEKDNQSHIPIDKILTQKVIKQGKSILINPNFSNRMAQLNKLKFSGNPPKSWLGVPLKIENKIFGAVIVKSYVNAFQYTDSELELLELFSNQIALAVSHKKAEDELKTTHQIYREAIEHAQGVPYRLNYSKNSYDILGKQAEQLLGIDFDKITLKKLKEIQQKVLIIDKNYPPDPVKYSKAFRNGKISKYRTDFLIKTPYGQTKWISDCAVPIRDNVSGKVIGSLGILQDITERKRIEEALKLSQQRYRYVIDDQTELICRHLPDGTVSFANEACCRFLNKKREEIIGKIYYPPLPEQDLDVILKQRSQLSLEKPIVSYEHQMINSDAKVCWFHRTDRAIFDENGMIKEFQSVARDITARKQAETELKKYRIYLEELVKERTQALSTTNQNLSKELIQRKQTELALEESKRRFELLYEENPSMYFTIDLKGKILSVNKFGAEQLGYSVEELINNSVFTVIYKDDKKIVQHQLKKMSPGLKKIKSWEFRKVKKNGKIIWVKESARLIKDDEGKSLILIVCEDISDKIKAQHEKERLIKELAEREKLATLGQFAAAITHEINNPLDIIMTDIESLNEDYHHLPELSISTEKIKEQVFKINHLAEDIMSYAKPHHPKFHPVDINKILVQTIEMLSEYHRDGIKIETKLKLNLPLITADLIGLGIVFKNIILNAIQSIEQEGTINIMTRYINNDQLRITVKDNGVGIEKSRLNKIFEQFHTSKQNVGGTGLGLAISAEIVKKHHGSIKVRSQLGSGTTFHVYLPAYS